MLVPYRGDDGGPRDQAWHHIRARWAAEHPDWPVIVGQCRAVAWIKGEAVVDAFKRARGGLAIVADADVWCGEGIVDAVERVAAGAPWAIPHRYVRRLDESASAAVLAGAPLTFELATRRVHQGFPGGGMVVLPRATLAAVPMDRRFAGWGQEDESWALALTTLVGPAWRGSADLYHLWHGEAAPRWSHHFGSKAGRALWMRYLAASRHPDLMRELLTGA